MSAPPNEGYGQYAGQPQDQYQQPAGDQSAQHFQQDAAAGAKKKKRAYAAGAFDVGSGANAGVGGQMSAGGQFGMPPAPGAQYGGYPQQQEPAQQSGYQYPQQGYGAPDTQAPQQPAYGGYQAPDQGYQSQAAPQPASSGPAGVGGITQGMANMQMGGAAQQPQQQPGQGPRGALLNQLYPTDLLSQPFNVAELDLPPPPIVLPPHVSIRRETTLGTQSSQGLFCFRPALLPQRMPTALPNTFDLP